MPTDTTPVKSRKMTKTERKARFMGIKRMFREKLSAKYKLNSLEYRVGREYISIMDRIGAEHLEGFLTFVGAKLPRTTLQMWTDVQKVDNLLNSLDRLRQQTR